MTTQSGPVHSWEERLRDAARGLPYPPTPDVARRVTVRLRDERSRQDFPTRVPASRLRIALVVVALFVVSLLAVPDVRATIGNWLRLGSVEIVFPTATPEASPSEQPLTAPTALLPQPSPEAPAPAVTAPSAPRPTATPLASVLDLEGETTLESARQQVRFPIKIPTYPEDLGPPDRVFVQDFGGPVAVLVWIEPGTRDSVRMSLHILGHDIFAQKFAGEITQVTETTVHGERALWVVGPHMLSVYARKSGSPNSRHVVGHVLIWEDGGITYRLETELPLDEAVLIAESAQ